MTSASRCSTRPGSGGLPGQRQRHRRRRPGAEAGLDPVPGRRLIHETTDVTDLLVPGANALGVRFAGGWATERYGFRGEAAPFYSDQPAVAGQLVVTYADGRRQVVATDGTWRVSTGARSRPAGSTRGEDHDARLGQRPAGTGRDSTTRAWSAAAAAATRSRPERADLAGRPPDRGARVREVITTPSGRTLLDFGQNLVGRLRLTVERAGRHDDHAAPRRGARARRAVHPPLRSAEATDRYTLAGEGRDLGAELHLPRLPLRRGRRLARSCRPRATSAAVVLHSDMERTGWFDCSRPAGQPAARERGLEHARQLPRRAHRLPAARRAPGLDGRHPGLRPHGVASCTTCAGFLSSWLADLAAEQRRRRHRARSCVPDVLHGPARARRGLGRRRRRRALGAVRALRRLAASWPPVRQHAGLGRLSIAGRPATGLWDSGSSSSATGSTRPRRRTTRPTRKTDPDIVATPTSPAPPTCVARRCSAARGDRRRGALRRDSPTRSARPSGASTSPRPGGW